MRVRVLPPGSNASGTSALSPRDHLPVIGPDSFGPWRPRIVIGGDSPGGLRLPDAKPSSTTLYGPRGVWLDEQVLAICDTGNHRVLLWLGGLPDVPGTPADVVLGQPDDHTEGPATGGPERGMSMPTGVLVDRGRLVVADAWHHRLLVWNSIPTATDTPADHVIGQPDPSHVDPNGSDPQGEPSAGTFYWPFGITVIDGRLYVADTGNRRVLSWRDGVPLDGRPADVVLGQPGPHAREENRGEGVGPASFRWPHDVAGTGTGGIFVTDAGNHRILRWDRHPEQDAPAHSVIGQPDFEAGSEFPYISQQGRFRFPYGIAADPQGTGLVVADTANNRVLVWPQIPTDAGQLPEHVLGQTSPGAGGENRWDAVADDTLCWPYGLAQFDRFVAVADSGNNRVVVWERR